MRAPGLEAAGLGHECVGEGEQEVSAPGAFGLAKPGCCPRARGFLPVLGFCCYCENRKCPRCEPSLCEWSGPVSPGRVSLSPSRPPVFTCAPPSRLLSLHRQLPCPRLLPSLSFPFLSFISPLLTFRHSTACPAPCQAPVPAPVPSP